MLDPFLIAFREALQCALLLSLMLYYPAVRERSAYSLSLILGVLAAILLGFPLGYIPALSKDLLSLETWTFWRYLFESVIFYMSIIVLIRRPQPAPAAIMTGLFLLGLLLFFFESRALGFLIRDMGAMQENRAGVLGAGIAGTIAGFLPLILFRTALKKIPFDKAFSLPSILMVIGALQFWFGGVAELERENILVPLQRGLLPLLGEAMRSLQASLMITEHPFLDAPFSGLARYLAGDRTALALTVLFIMTPPLLILIHLFSRPDPVVSNISVSAQRRQKIAFFRDELLYQTTPVLTVFVVLVVMLHAVNVSMNPLYEPPPVPVRESENTTVIRIPLTDKGGDLGDKKLRKYVYYFGSKQIIFIAILKPDGTVGVALDECEICRPAEWNVDAKGYAQKGEHLICKYCMTPVATSTINNPGGCNPIPIPFKMDDNRIVISLNDLIPLYQKVQELEKKGTHL